MKAILLQKYGSIDDLIYTDVPKPFPGENEVLVKVKYTSINAADLDYVHGHPLVRFTGLIKPGNQILGSDLVGVVEANGLNVSHFQKGDIVWADTSFPLKYGTFAEYTVVPAKALQKLSNTVNLIDASCLPSAGVVALQNVQMNPSAKQGDTALVNGAGGGIGNMIVQLLHAAGVNVTAVDKKGKHEMLKTIGVTRTIDYETTDYTRENVQYDYVYDLVGHQRLKQAVMTVKKNGLFIMLGGSTKNILRVVITAPLLSAMWGRKIKLGAYRTNNHKDLTQLVELLENKTVKPFIDRVIPFKEAIEGLRTLEAGNVLGKIVIEYE